MEEPPGVVDLIVETALGVEVSDWTRPRNGRSAKTYIIEIEGESDPLICKIGGPSVFTDAVIEPLVVEFVAERTTLPVPAVIARGHLTGVSHPWDRWALYEYIQGMTPASLISLDSPSKKQLLHGVGSILGELHTRCTFDRLGGLDREDGCLMIRPCDGLNFPMLERRIRTTFNKSDGESAVLGHGDLFPGNLMIDDHGRITGVFDWANGHVTDPGYDLAVAELRFIDWFNLPPEASRQALLEGYRQHRSVPDTFTRLHRRYKLLWLLQNGEQAIRQLTTPHGRRQLRKMLPAGHS